jgi:hypothetical protein
MPVCAHCPRQTIAAGLPVVVYLKCSGNQQFGLAASGHGSSPNRYDGHVSSGIWREVFFNRKHQVFGMQTFENF